MPTPACELRIGAHAQQSAFDLAGSRPAVCEIEMLNGITQDQAGAVRFDILEKMRSAVDANFFLLIIVLQRAQQPIGHFSLGQNASERAFFIQNRQPA